MGFIEDDTTPFGVMERCGCTTFSTFDSEKSVWCNCNISILAHLTVSSIVNVDGKVGCKLLYFFVPLGDNRFGYDDEGAMLWVSKDC